MLGASKGLYISNNIFFTLALGVLMLNILEQGRSTSHRWKKVLCIGGVAAVLVLGAVLAEGGIIVLPFMLTAYVLRDRVALRNGLWLAGSAVLLALSYVPYPTRFETLVMLGYNSDFLFVLAIPFLMLYNGECGPKTAASKYLFYGFYPLHLWVIGLLALAVA